MSSKRQNYSAEFKARVAMEAIIGDKTINEIASANGIHPNPVLNWKKELAEGAKEIFDKKRGRKPANDMNDPDNLLRQIGQLNIDIDWLKKKGSEH